MYQNHENSYILAEAWEGRLMKFRAGDRVRCARKDCVCGSNHVNVVTRTNANNTITLDNSITYPSEFYELVTDGSYISNVISTEIDTNVENKTCKCLDLLKGHEPGCHYASP